MCSQVVLGSTSVEAEPFAQASERGGFLSHVRLALASQPLPAVMEAASVSDEQTVWSG